MLWNLLPWGGNFIWSGNLNDILQLNSLSVSCWEYRLGDSRPPIPTGLKFPASSPRPGRVTAGIRTPIHRVLRFHDITVHEHRFEEFLTGSQDMGLYAATWMGFASPLEEKKLAGSECGCWNCLGVGEGGRLRYTMHGTRGGAERDLGSWGGGGEGWYGRGDR